MAKENKLKSNDMFNPKKWIHFIEWLAKDYHGWKFCQEDKLWKQDGLISMTTEEFFLYYY